MNYLDVEVVCGREQLGGHAGRHEHSEKEEREGSGFCPSSLATERLAKELLLSRKVSNKKLRNQTVVDGSILRRCLRSSALDYNWGWLMNVKIQRREAKGRHQSLSGQPCGRITVDSTCSAKEFGKLD